MKYLYLVCTLLLAACTTCENCNVQQSIQNVCTQPSCRSSSYTVRKPVEVIYKDTTYTTVYEPRIYTTTKMIRRPYNNCLKNELCK